jgi:Zn finger protein HypA/HybF involved in hydrogenase expression
MNEETISPEEHFLMNKPLHKIKCGNCGSEDWNITHIQKADDEEGWMLSCSNCNEVRIIGDFGSMIPTFLINNSMIWEDIKEDSDRG